MLLPGKPPGEAEKVLCQMADVAFCEGGATDGVIEFALVSAESSGAVHTSSKWCASAPTAARLGPKDQIPAA